MTNCSIQVWQWWDFSEPIRMPWFIKQPMNLLHFVYTIDHIKGLFSQICQNGEIRIRLTHFQLKQAKFFMICLYYVKQTDSLLPCICSVMDHRKHQNVVTKNISQTHMAYASCATFLFLPHFDVIFDLLQNRCMATWNLFDKYIYTYISEDWSNI